MPKTVSAGAPLERESQTIRHKKCSTLRAVVGDALTKRRASAWPVSVADTVNQVRAAMPECDLTDDELADLVAIAAMEHGLSISFDRDRLEADNREGTFA